MKWQIQSAPGGVLMVVDLESGHPVPNVSDVRLEASAQDGCGRVEITFHLFPGGEIQLAPWRERPPVQIKDRP